MSEADSATFGCEACQRRYKWKPQLAGRKVKCRCGQVMTAPLNVGHDAAVADLYALADEPAQPAKISRPTPPPSPAPVSRQPIKPAAQVLPYGSRPTTRTDQRDEELANTLGGKPWKELYLPAGLVMLGLVFHLWPVITGDASWQRVGFYIGIKLVANLVISFIGIFIAAKLMDLSFGNPGTAALKLSAIILLPPAIAGLLGNLVGHDSALVAYTASGISMSFLALAGFWWLFDLELSEAIYCVVIIWLVNDWILYYLAILLFGLHGSGAL